jgi:hypothetical protein
MNILDIHLKSGDQCHTKLDTETLDSLLADWKNKVSKITRYKGVMWYGREDSVATYLFLIPNTITSIFVQEEVNES